MVHLQNQESNQKGRQDQKSKNSGRDIEICAECTALLKAAADKCRAWSKESQTSMCKGGLATAAFVCDGIARSMEECMSHMKEGHH